MANRRAASCLLALALLLPCHAAHAGDVELAPFFGLQYGGSLATTFGQRYAIDPGIQYGATLDVPFNPEWGFELLYARQATELASRPRLGLAVERYLAGVRQEKDAGRARLLGVALVGLTRVVPDGLGSDERFTLAIGLGLRRPLTRHVGIRADVRGYYAFLSSAAGTLCADANCLFAFGSDGVWQGDVTGALMWTF
jgi:hypothetical protein